MGRHDADLAVVPVGPRARMDGALVEAVAERYGLGPVRAVRDIGGTYNLNVRLETGAGAYVLRVHRPWVSAERLAMLHDLRADLIRAGVPAVAPLPTPGGERAIQLGDRLVEVEPFVAHDGHPDTWARHEAAFAQLGTLHDALERWGRGRRVVPPLVANYAEPASLMRWVERTAARVDEEGHDAALSARARRSARRTCEAALTLLRELEPWWRAAGSELPRQPIHGDYGGENLLFAGERVRAVLDFDFLAIRERVFDLASSIFWMLRREEGARPASAWPWVRVGRLLAAYDAATARPLTEHERAALPWEIARVPLYWVGEAGLIDDPAGRVCARTPDVESAGWVLRHRAEIARVSGAEFASESS